MTGPTRVITERDRLAESWIYLDAGPVIFTDASAGKHFRVRLTEDARLEPPHGGGTGRVVVWRIEQDGTGGRTLSVSSDAFVTRGTLPATYIDDAANAVSFLVARYDEVTGLWELQGTPLLTDLLDTLGAAQRGTILFRGAAGWQFLDPGTEGQVLTAHGAADPTWET